MKAQPAAKVLMPFAAGLIAGSFLDLTAESLWIVLSGVALLTAILFVPSVRYSATGVWLTTCCFLILGFLQHELSRHFFPTNHISNYCNASTSSTLIGEIVSYPEAREKHTNFVIAADSLAGPNGSPQCVSGKVLVSLPRQSTQLEYGDRVLLVGKITRPPVARNPGEFDYAEYLAAQDIFATISKRDIVEVKRLSSGHGSWFFRAVVVSTKSYLEKVIERLPGSEAALLKGLLIGERGEISAELRDNFAKAGVIHILAVSGLHVGFIVIALITATSLFRLPYSVRVVVTILGLIFYAYLTNLKPSVLRAVTMAAFILAGTALQRKTNFLNSVSLAALLILFIRPLDLFQSGFQLSFAAVMAIVYLYPKMRELAVFSFIYDSSKPYGILRYPTDLFLVSIAALVGTLPLTVIHFGRLPLLSLPANLLVVPLSFVALGNGILASIAHLFSSQLADTFLATSYLSLRMMVGVVNFSSRLPLAFVEIHQLSIFAVAIYCCLLISVVNFRNGKIFRRGILASLFLCSAWIWQGNFYPNDELTVTVIDVGQGDSILLTFPDGRHALVDGGKRSLSFDSGERIVAPFLRRQGIDRLDALILSHGDSDHLGGFPYLMRHFEIGEVWDNGLTKDTRLFGEYIHLIDSLAIPHKIWRAGDIITDFEPVQIYVLHPNIPFASDPQNSPNDASLSFKMTYGEIDFLFLGDIEKRGELDVTCLGSFLQSEVLKVSHHGSKTSSTLGFLAQVKPELALISVGTRNKFGHPSPEILARLKKTNAEVIRTDLERAIILTTDGQHIDRVHW